MKDFLLEVGVIFQSNAKRSALKELVEDWGRNNNFTLPLDDQV